MSADIISYSTFIQWGFALLVTFLIYKTEKAIVRMQESVSNLNEKLAVVIERSTTHHFELEKQDKRIQRLETKLKRTA
ncbi:MAG: hypothetical protein IPQ08_06235 [Chitinophagaceae bacterium]|nr:hypothetical protein [Chitinophagaceae bacterium]